MATPQPIQQRSTKPAAPPSRMTLATVTHGKVDKPPRVLLYGVEGVGKSSFGAAAPSPIFIASEEGANNLDVARFPKPENWSDVIDAVRALTVEGHDHRTLVVDTLDAIEPLCWRVVCEKATRSGKSADSIEDLGYGKGYVAALDEWRVLLAALERLWSTKGMGIILIAHSLVKPFKNPEGDDFDRYQLKLHDKAGGLIKEWTDCNLFARFEIYANKKKGELKAKGVGTGARIIHTQRTAAYDAKNRYDLPEQMPLDWQTFADAIKAHRPADPAKLIATIEEHLTSLADESVTTRVRAALAKSGENAAELARIANHLTALTNAKENA